MLLEKVVKQLELQKINEDSLVSAYASLKYANKMLANAHEKNLHSKQYWTDKKNHASKRIETLKSKGEEETEDTHKQADELLNKIEAKNKLGWKELLKNPEVRKNASNFVKEISNHVSLKAIIVHTSHHFHNLVKPVINTTKNFFKNPKSTISNLKETSKKYFKSVFQAGKNTKVIAVNANNAFKDIHKKYKTKFTEEEKKGLMNDPDKFLSKLHNSLTKEEINDIKMYGKYLKFKNVCTFGQQNINSDVYKKHDDYEYNKLDVKHIITVEDLKEEYENDDRVNLFMFKTINDNGDMNIFEPWILDACYKK